MDKSKIKNKWEKTGLLCLQKTNDEKIKLSMLLEELRG